MKSLCKLCLALLTLTSISLAQAGATYYVSQSGSDSNSGSASAPWLTIQHAASTVTAGATVYVETGTYKESVTFANSGTSSEPIVFNGQGVAILDGTGVSCCTTPRFESSNNFLCCNTQGLFNIGSSSGVSYLTIEDFTIQNYKTSSKNECSRRNSYCRQRNRDQHTEQHGQFTSCFFRSW